jgi:thiamine-phosphate diphosphorylase
MTALARPCVYLVTDRRALAPEARTAADEVAALERWLDDAIDAGVDVIQLRERDLDASLLCACAKRVAERARARQTLVLVNDRADIAVASAADGVHLRASSAPDVRVRAMAAAGWVIGRSVHAAAEAAAHATVDYVMFGTMFAGGSKPAGSPVQGVDALSRAVGATPVPVIAIGGITPERARECAAAGAAGVAGIGVFLPEGRVAGALGPARAAAALRASCTEGLDVRRARSASLPLSIPPC